MERFVLLARLIKLECIPRSGMHTRTHHLALRPEMLPQADALTWACTGAQQMRGVDMSTLSFWNGSPIYAMVDEWYSAGYSGTA